jgi:hypothetical protein
MLYYTNRLIFTLTENPRSFAQTATLAVPPTVHSLTFSELLSKAIGMSMSMADIMNRLVVQYDISTERSTIVKLAQQWAVQEGHHGVILAELGQYIEEAEKDDPIADFPPVRPVAKPDPEYLGVCSINFLNVSLLTCVLDVRLVPSKERKGGRSIQRFHPAGRPLSSDTVQSREHAFHLAGTYFCSKNDRRSW